MSKLLRKKWEERAYQQHLQKIQAAKGGIDNKPPKRFPHLDMKVTKVRKEEEKLAQVHYENQILVQRLTGIMGRRASYDSQRENYLEPRSLNIHKREKESERIYKSNQAIAQRLEKIRPVINSRDQVESWQKHLEYRKLRLDTTKTYPEGLTKQGERNMHERQRSRSLDGMSEDVFYDYGSEADSDGEREQQLDEDDDDREEVTLSPSDYAYLYSDDDDNVPEEKWMKKKKEPQPQLKNAYGEAVKLPQIQSKRNYYGSLQHQNEMDARALQKACKFNSQFREIFTRSLMNRSVNNRGIIKERFKKLFHLELEEELKKQCKPPVHPIITALLTPKGGVEDAEELHEALCAASVPRLIQMLCSRNKTNLNSLQNSYKTHYKKTIDTALNEVIIDRDVEALLLLLLRKDGRQNSTGDDVLAKTDARKLHMAGKGRWTDENGAFLKIVSTRSYPQISETMLAFRGVIGQNLWEAAEEDTECSPVYAKAIKAFGMIMHERGAVVATQLHNAMKDPAKFIKCLVDAADSDLPSVKQAYKQKYSTDLENDIRVKFRGDQATYLLDLCNKQPPPKARVRTRNALSFPLPVTKQRKGFTSFSANRNTEEPEKNSPSPSPPLSPEEEKDNDKTQKKTVRWNDSASDNISEDTVGVESESSGIEKISDDTSTNEDCERLYEAMCGFGTDEDIITDILTQRTNKQRQKIREKYLEIYDKKLIRDLKSELSGDYEEVIMSLMMTPSEYLAYCIHHDIDEAEMEADALVSLIQSRNEELESIKREYKRAYNINLAEDLKERGNGDLKQMMLALLKMSSEESGQEKVDKLAESLQDAPSHFAQLIHNCLDGFGTDERSLIRIIVARSEIDLGAISKKYKEKFGKKLLDIIKSKTSGDFKDSLIAILRKS